MRLLARLFLIVLLSGPPLLALPRPRSTPVLPAGPSVATFRPTTASRPATIPATAPAGKTLKTAHYEIYAESVDIDEVGRILEAYHTQATAWFGKAPKGPLQISIYASRERFNDALKADNVEPYSGGGYYSPKTNKAYLWVQPLVHFTRHLILHEATHQFHWQVATDNRLPFLLYSEGMAEYFALHTWDGKSLELHRIPAFSYEDYPGAALKQFREAHGRDLRSLIGGAAQCDRPVAWSIVHFVATQYPSQFKAWCARMDRHPADTLAAWTASFGPVTAAFVDKYEIWLVENQQPWNVASPWWQQKGAVIEGRMPGRTSLAVLLLKQPPRAMSVKLAPQAGGEPRAGLMLNFKSWMDYSVLQMHAGKLSLIRAENGAWRTVQSWRAPPDFTLSFETIERELTFKAEKQRVTIALDGQVGLFVHSGTVQFTPTITPRPTTRPTTRSAPRTESFQGFLPDDFSSRFNPLRVEQLQKLSEVLHQSDLRHRPTASGIRSPQFAPSESWTSSIRCPGPRPRRN